MNAIIKRVTQLFLLLVIVLLAVSTYQIVNGQHGIHNISAMQADTQIIPVDYNFPIAMYTGQDRVSGKPGIAFDGTNFLVPYLKDYDIFARRVSQTGVILDTTPITISVGLNLDAATPSIAFDGANYLLVWTAYRSGVGELFGARVTPAGTVLDMGGIALTTGANALIRMPGIAFDGTNYLVVYRTSLNNIYAMRISPGMSNLDAPSGFMVVPPPQGSYVGAYYYPAVAFGGTNYLVVWYGKQNFAQTNYDIYGARITPQGQVLDPNGFVICNEPAHQGHPTVGFNGTNYVVAWYDERPSYDEYEGSAYVARVSMEGIVLDVPPLKISDRSYGQYAGPKVVCGGHDCLVVWDINFQSWGNKYRLTDLWGRRVTATGQVLDPQAIPVATAYGNQFGAVGGYGNGRYLIAWSESNGRVDYGSIYGQILEEQDVPQNLPIRLPPAEEIPSAPLQNDWTIESAPVDRYATGGLAFSANNVYAFGSSNAVHYNNGAWQDENIDSIGLIFSSWASAPDNIWIGSLNFIFNRYDGQNWLVAWGIPGDNHGPVNGFWGSNPSELLASGGGGIVLYFDGISYWVKQSTGVPYDLSDIWGTSYDNLYVVGERGTVLHSTGSGWVPQVGIPTIQRLNAIDGSGPNDIFAVGDWGTILHYDGINWSKMDGSTLEDLFDVRAFSSDNVYAVGNSGTILHYNGITWMAEDTGTTMDLESVWGVRSGCDLIVWASGRGPQILKKEMGYNCEFLPIINN